MIPSDSSGFWASDSGKGTKIDSRLGDEVEVSEELTRPSRDPMRKLTIIFALLCTGAIAADKPVVRYAGDGRYTCSGNSPECAQVAANNRAREQQRQSQDDARREREYEQRKRDLERYQGR